MLGRILILLRARLAAQGSDAAFPAAAILMQGFVSAVVCGLVRGELPPFAYALVALSTSAALVAIPLLGELSRLLLADETGDWIRAQPVRAIELHLARTAHLLIALGVLSLGALVPAALLAQGFDAAGRIELVLLGLGQSLTLAAALLAVQALLRGRAQALLVVVQTALFLGVLVGASIGLRLVPQMRGWNSATSVESALAFPPAWFAAPFSSGELPGVLALAAPIAIALSVALLLGLPAPEVRRFQRGTSLLEGVLAPLRRFAVRTWVHGRERASFEWLYEALPREREFVLRTYPLLAVPAAFLWISASGESAAAKQGWLALLLFIPGAYVPLLAAHVPGSDSHRARWILDTAPIQEAEVRNGAIKALTVRFLVPFYALLILIGCLLGGAQLMLQLALPALVCAVLVLRLTWSRCVTLPPLSISPDSILVSQDWIGLLATAAGALSLVAVLASRVVTGPLQALAFAALALAVERAFDRRSRVSPR